MRKSKVFAFIIGFILLLFGAVGFLLVGSSNSNIKENIIASPLVINDVNGIAVDSKGQIYIGDGQKSSIQVFDDKGNFLYGYTFTTGGSGWFAFGIDSDDIIHLVTARTNSYMKYKNTEQIYSEIIEYDRQQSLIKTYNMQTGNKFQTKDKEYKVRAFHRLEIADHSRQTVDTITIKVPFWPFSTWFYWLIGAIGMCLFFWSFAWDEFIKLHNKKSTCYVTKIK